MYMRLLKLIAKESFENIQTKVERNKMASLMLVLVLAPNKHINVQIVIVFTCCCCCFFASISLLHFICINNLFAGLHLKHQCTAMQCTLASLSKLNGSKRAS